MMGRIETMSTTTKRDLLENENGEGAKRASIAWNKAPGMNVKTGVKAGPIEMNDDPNPPFNGGVGSRDVDIP
jgi:hypothetical protein